MLDLPQHELLQHAKASLGMTWKEFAKRLGSPVPTLKKWLASPADTSNYREMPSTVRTLVNEILEHEALKKKFARLQEKYKKGA